MRTYVSAFCWATAILSLAVAARFGWLDRATADLLLMVLPMIAYITLLGGRDCRLMSRDA